MDADDPTLDEYLDEWFALQRTRIEPTTWRSYHDMARACLRPQLGHVKLRELTVRQLDRHYVELLVEGGRRGRPLARRTVEYAHVLLHKALKDAVKVELLDDNVAARATVPRVAPGTRSAPERLRVWDAAQVRRFLELSATDPFHDLWRVALGTGMRRSELLGLRWDDVDLTVPQLRVTTALGFVDGRPFLKGTKSGRSRTLHLDHTTVAAIDRQPRRTGEWPLVFAREDGSPWSPPYVSDRWRKQWPRLDLPRITLHALRHVHATQLLLEGVPIKVVSERLGHSKIALTMDIYAHVLPAMDRDAAAAIGRVLGPEVRGQSA
jgi:integrase